MSGQQTVDIKVVILGDSGIGKTCLLVRFLKNQYGSTTATIGASFAVKNIQRNGEVYTLGIWDTAGQERYNSLSSFYCRSAGCALVCYDITSKDSFNSLDNWLEKLYSSGPGEDCFTILVGLKLDLAEQSEENFVNESSDTDSAKREVSTEEAREKAEKMGAIAFFETSAKSGDNVHSVFETIVDQLQKQPKKKTKESNDDQLTLGKQNNVNNDDGGCRC